MPDIPIESFLDKLKEVKKAFIDYGHGPDQTSIIVIGQGSATDKALMAIKEIQVQHPLVFEPFPFSMPIIRSPLILDGLRQFRFPRRKSSRRMQKKYRKNPNNFRLESNAIIMDRPAPINWSSAGEIIQSHWSGRTRVIDQLNIRSFSPEFEP